VQARIHELISGLSLSYPPNGFLSVVIRRGDKISESEYASLSLYVDAVRPFAGKYSGLFIAGDDLSAMQSLAKLLPDFNCFYLEPPFANGYDNRLFRSMSSNDRETALIRFLAQIEMLRSSAVFVGTKTTNAAFMVNTLRGGKCVVWVD